MLKPGDKVYRVVERDGPRLHHCNVKAASDKQIRLGSYFYGLWRSTFDGKALGRAFFATKPEALADFTRRCLAKLAEMETERSKVLEWLEWAEKQAGQSIG